MLIGDRLRALREAKNLSEEDIEERTGLLRSYLSEVENGETVPSIETLEDIACALEVPLYQLFCDGKKQPILQHLPNRRSAEDIAWGDSERVRGLVRVSLPAVRSHRRAGPAVTSVPGSKERLNEITANNLPKLAQCRAEEKRENANNALMGEGIVQGTYFYQNWTGMGLPMDLRCPHCNSDDLNKVSLAYQEGLDRINTHTRLTGVLIGNGGPDMIWGRARTTGFRQTEFSKRLSPPTKWSYLKLILWSGILSLAALIGYVDHAMASTPPVSVLPVKIYAVLFSGVLSIALIVFWRHNHSTYPGEYTKWDRSYVCQRCGIVSLAQTDLEQNLL